MKINEDKTEFDSKTGTLWHTYGPKTAAKVNLFLKLAKEAGHEIEQHGGMFTIITPNNEDYYTSTIELSRMTNQEIEDYVNDLLEPEDFDESFRSRGKTLKESVDMKDFPTSSFDFDRFMGYSGRQMAKMMAEKYIDKAIKMRDEHPDWSTEDVAEEIGISLERTFDILSGQFQYQVEKYIAGMLEEE